MTHEPASAPDVRLGRPAANVRRARRAWSASVCGSLAIGLWLTGGPAWSADRITIRPRDSAGLIVVTGDVQDYNDRFLSLWTGSPSRVQTYAGNEIVAVETYRTPSHVEGLKLYRQGDMAGAIARLDEALQSEQRKWMRREVLAWLTRAYRRQGDLHAAALRFVEIVSEEPHTRFWSAAPLLWTPQPIPERLQVAARRWLASPSEAVRLVGASLLLGDATGRILAVAELHKLARTQDRYVGPLAQAQLWGATLESNVTSVEELLRWQRDIDRMPESIRGGPWYAIGQVRLHRSEPDEAAAALLRVLVVYDDDEQLAARSGLEAALALTRINRDDEAKRILEEVVERFPWSDAAGEARQKLDHPAEQ